MTISLENIQPTTPINLGSLPKEQRVAACVNSVSQLDLGQSAEFSLPYFGGPKIDDIFVGVKSTRPDVLVVFDNKTKTLSLSPQTVNEQFTENEPVPNLDDMLGEIKNESDREVFKDLLRTATSDADLNAEQRNVFSGGYFVEQILGTFPTTMDSGDIETMKKILLASVDAGNEIGGNSAFARARNLVINRTLLQPEGFNPQRNLKLMDVAINMDRDKVSDTDKLSALVDAIKYATWASRKREELQSLREMKDEEGWRMANILLKKDVTQMPDVERKEVKTYFEKLIKESKEGTGQSREINRLRKLLIDSERPVTDEIRIASEQRILELSNSLETSKAESSKKLEIFRSLADGFETNEVWSRFTQYHDLSVYGTAEYWASSSYKLNMFKTNLTVELPILGQTLNVGLRSNGDASDFAEAVVKLMSISQEKMKKRLKREQNARLMSCPSCYGYGEGAELQQKIQDGGGVNAIEIVSENDVIKNKKSDWALQMDRL